MPNTKGPRRQRTGSKRLNNGQYGASGSRPARGRGRGRGGRGGLTAGKGRKAVLDARANISQRQGRGRGGRRGASTMGARLGSRISDARQILNSQVGRSSAARSRGTSRSPRTFRAPPSAAASVINTLSLSTTSERNMFSQAVRAAMAPVLAPLLTSRPTSTSSSSTSTNKGPCALRVANLASSVTVNDLNDLFNSFAGFVGASFESGGIAVVSFAQHSSAVSAQDEYNNRELDGRTMVIQLDTSGSSSGPAGHGASSRLGPKP